MNNQTWPFANPVDPNIYSERKDWPKISIVTPSYNQGQYIEETILSILNQNYPNLEYIIIDGCSTDNTVEIIKKYEDRITYWISEPDRGQAHAINKGLEKCTGEIFNWLNSDDYLSEGSLKYIAENFNIETFDLLAGSVLNFWTNSPKTSLYTNQNINLANILKVIRKSNLKYHQPGVWLNTSKVRRTGIYNDNSHYCFDIEHLISYLIQFSNVKYINEILVHFRYHEESKSVQFAERFSLDFVKCLKSKKSNDIKLARKITRKYRASKWDLHLKRYILKSNQKKIFYIVRNLLLNPKDKITRYSLITLWQELKTRAVREVKFRK